MALPSLIHDDSKDRCGRTAQRKSWDNEGERKRERKSKIER